MVTITGTNLSGTSAVHFGTAKAKIDKLVSATAIKVTAPPGTGKVDVTVSTTTSGTSRKTAADRYTYLPRPAITKLSPNKGPASGGTVITVSGMNLSGASAVHFRGAEAKIDKHISATAIKITAPPGSGTVDVTVTTAGGTSAKTPADRYTY